MPHNIPRYLFLPQVQISATPYSPVLSNLDLETSGTSATTSLLELATLGLDIWLLVLVGTEAKVLDGLTGILGTSKKKGVAASWGSEGQLVDSQSLTTGGKDAGTGGSSEAESRNTELRDLQKAVVIGDGANNDNGSLLILASVRNNSGDGDGWSVDAGHKQSAEDDFVEGRVGTAGQEAVELHEQLEVHIITLGRLSVRAADVMSVEIDTHCCGCRRCC